MKTIKFLKIVLIFLFIGCVKNNEFEVPTVTNEENIKLNAILEAIEVGEVELQSIAQIKKLYTSGEAPLQIVSNIIIRGYVVSSDREGNFFKEIYIQDAPENPSAGIKIILNLTNSYNKYNIGREVYVRLEGLYIGESNSGDGITAIGGAITMHDPLEVEAITSNQIEAVLFRSEKTETMVPKVVPINGINTTHIGVFVAIENSAFDSNVIGKSYVDPSDDFDTQRNIVVCQGLGFFSMPLETSSFALFANKLIPPGGGVINAVVTKDFRGDVFVLALNSTDDVVLSSTRCEPIDNDDFLVLLEQDFETTSGNIEISNWIHYIEAGTKFWRSYDDEDSLSKAATIGSFFSRNESTITWLITEPINLETIVEAFLSFETSNSFGDNSNLEVLITKDWNGNTANVTMANWKNLPAKIIDNSTSFDRWVHSGYIDLSSYLGSVVYIAFKYTGSGDENNDGTYELDNIKIEGR